MITNQRENVYFKSNNRVMFATLNRDGQTRFDPHFPATTYAQYNSEPSFATDSDRLTKYVKATAAWDTLINRASGSLSQTVGNHATKLGIVDTAVDLTNPDLIPNLWINQREIPDDVMAKVYDCDCDGYLTFIDLNWSSYFSTPCTQCPGMTDKNPGNPELPPPNKKFRDPPPNADDPVATVGLNDKVSICNKCLHAPFDLCDPGDIVTGTSASCLPKDHGEGLCFSWEDGVQVDRLGNRKDCVCLLGPDRCAGFKAPAFCDDVVGWNFGRDSTPADPSPVNPDPACQLKGRTQTVGPTYPLDIVPFMGSFDPNGHGTQVASAAGSARGQDGTIGIAWNVAIVPMRISLQDIETEWADVLTYARFRELQVVNFSVDSTPNIAGVTPSECSDGQPIKLRRAGMMPSTSWCRRTRHSGSTVRERSSRTTLPSCRWSSWRLRTATMIWTRIRSGRSLRRCEKSGAEQA